VTPELSVVMPAHNEAAQIDASIEEWYDSVVARIPGAELVVVDDCSSDGTGARLAALATQLPELRVLRTPANVGHGRAVRFGLERCRGTFVFQTDSDRPHRPADFWNLWDRRNDVDFAFGVRQARNDGAWRQLVSYGLCGANGLIWGRWIRDANCPFKLMRRDALEALLTEIPCDSFIPMVMVSVLGRHLGYRVIDVPVPHFERSAGEPSLKGIATWVPITFRCVRELVALRLSIARRDARPRAGV
jgi:glycosyltransferase involved in cell wall biosynthesis